MPLVPKVVISPSLSILIRSVAVSQAPLVAVVPKRIPPPYCPELVRFKALSFEPPKFPVQTALVSKPPSCLKIIKALSPSVSLSLSASIYNLVSPLDFVNVKSPLTVAPVEVVSNFLTLS